MDQLGPIANRIREIHIPDGVATWPPAPGWWVLAGLAVLMCLLLFRLWWRRTALRREALREMDRLERAYQADSDGAALLAGLSILLKRVALAREPRDQIAGLTGESWLVFLDRRLGETAFSEGPGRVFKDGPYAPSCSIDGPEVLRLARRWIRRVA